MVKTATIVGDLKTAQTAGHAEGHRGFGCTGMAGNVGDRLSESSQQMLRHLLGDHRVERTHEGDRDVEADYRSELTNKCQSTSSDTGGVRAELEDAGSDLADRVIDVSDRHGQPLGHGGP